MSPQTTADRARELSTERESNHDVLRIVGARTHNLKHISLDIPHNQLTVITGVSGSGKSSLAFDTIYAEGQRQYIESLSTYARQFLNQLQRPDVDAIEGLQPTLCIDQRVASASPRSTVGTITEVYDYLRLMMARVATPHCYSCGTAIQQQSPEAILRVLRELPERTKLVLMAPMVRGRRGAHRDVLSAIQKAGLVRVRVDNQLYDIESVPELAVRKNHTIEAVVDKIVIRPDTESRLVDSLGLALRLADGLAAASYLTPEAENRDEANEWKEQFFSTRYACVDCDISYEELEPRTFSFNSPYGACPACDGVGQQVSLSPELMIEDWERSPKSGSLGLLKNAPSTMKRRLKREIQTALEGLGGAWDQPLSMIASKSRTQFLASLVEAVSNASEFDADAEAEWLDEFKQDAPCEVCCGARLRPEALSVRLDGKNIHDICQLNLGAALSWFEGLKFSADLQPIAKPIMEEMLHRLRFLVKVGVTYLSLARGADTLSGGELQRVRLATSIGSGLVGVCYILDEPSIGLHQRDNQRLIDSLRDLQRQGNTVIVVEHDDAMMEAADLLVDMGPGAGKLGGNIVAHGSPKDVTESLDSLTALYLRGDRRVCDKEQYRKPSKHALRLKGANLHNLTQVDVEIPLGLLVGITGVSGSGKSSLVVDTLVPALAEKIGQRRSYHARRYFKSLSGYKDVEKLIEITQAPIGRTPRSTPATYCGVFDLIRAVWANTRESKTRGYTASRFSFNAGGGRCEKCQGQGQEKIEMNFLPDLYVTCSVCSGKRFNRQTLQVRYREKNIADVLAMSVDEACEFFENFEKIHRLLRSLQDVGLGYLSLGQSSSTLSGGESQRIKLASELAKPESGSTVYFLDEPTTGLHFEDIKRLVHVLDGLVERGNTVIVIEHNLDVIRACDWLIDLGPEGGEAGGNVVATGTPADIAGNKHSLTGQYL